MCFSELLVRHRNYSKGSWKEVRRGVYNDLFTLLIIIVNGFATINSHILSATIAQRHNRPDRKVWFLDTASRKQKRVTFILLRARRGM